MKDYYNNFGDLAANNAPKLTTAEGLAVFPLPAVGAVGEFEYKASAVGYRVAASPTTSDLTELDIELEKFPGLTFTDTLTGALVEGDVIVPNKALNNKVSITVQGGSDNSAATYVWETVGEDPGVGVLTGDGTKTYTANIDAEGIHTFTVYDPISKEMFNAEITFKVVSFNATGHANIEAGEASPYTAVGAAGVCR